MKHNKAIQCIQAQIKILQSEVSKAELIIDNPEMLSDYHYAKCDAENFTREIMELTETLEILIKL